MKINKTAIFIAVIGLSTNAFAQNTKKLSLKEAITLGLENSNTLKISDAKIKEAEANAIEAKDRQLPDFKISGSYLRIADANINLKAATPTPSATTTGTQQAAAPKANQAIYGMANLSWPVFSGGRIRYGIESSKYLLEATKLIKANDTKGIIYNITQAYVDLFKAAQVVTVVKENLEAAQQRDEQYIRLENTGLIPRNDRLKSQLQTSQIELQLMEAESNYKLAMINIDLLLGLPEQTNLILDSTFEENKVTTYPLAYYESKALESRTDLQANEYRQKAATLSIKAAKAEVLPSLAITGGYIAADIPKILTITNAVNAGIGVQYNLASLWKKNTGVKKAQAQQAQLTAIQDQLIDNIHLEVNHDYEAALLADRKIAAYQKALNQAQENYNIVNNKYKNGLATVTDVLDANAALFTTQINITNAKADAALSYQKLLQTAGIIHQ